MKQILFQSSISLKTSEYTWFIFFSTLGVLLVFIFLLSQKNKKALSKQTSQPVEDQDVGMHYTPLLVLGSVLYENRNYFSFLLKKRVYVKRVERILETDSKAHFKVFFFEKEKPEDFYALEISNQYGIQKLTPKEKQILKSKFFQFEHYNDNIQIIVDEHASGGKYSHSQTWYIPKIGKPYLERAVIGIG